MADATSGGGPVPPPAGGPTPTDELFAEALGITPASRAQKQAAPPSGHTAPPQIPAAEPSPGPMSPGAARGVHGAGDQPPAPAGSAAPFRWSWLQQRRTRARRTHRILRHIDPWSVFKVSALLYACLYVAVLAAGVLLWNAAQRSGFVEKIESFITEVGSYERWRIDGMVIYQRARIIGLIVATVGVAFNVVMAIMFNLISDLTGGIRVTVLTDSERPPAR
ncbi:DUF3566 domain-containing protein [Candidatus Poriferisodalis sp.]|uniref:DUF3566 domain-containing protein n=1 Tax=Candidatus Poriferisodalis sp. TaxID=3101277 RepID=UPI003B0290F9